MDARTTQIAAIANRNFRPPRVPCIPHIMSQGVGGLYKGLAPACLRHVVYSGSRVMVYEFLRENVLLKDEHGNFPLWKGALAGMSSGVIGQAIATPTDLVKVQMQADGKRILAGKAPRYKGTCSDGLSLFFTQVGLIAQVVASSGTMDAFATIYRQGGYRGLYKGIVPSCQRAGLVRTCLGAADRCSDDTCDAMIRVCMRRQGSTGRPHCL
eukprot:SAG31_NODE_4838_length_2913_cov_2.769367_1_plen_211_part_00